MARNSSESVYSVLIPFFNGFRLCKIEGILMSQQNWHSKTPHAGIATEIAKSTPLTGIGILIAKLKRLLLVLMYLLQNTLR